MTKEELVDYIHEYLQRNDESQLYHDEVISHTISKVYSQLAFDIFESEGFNSDILTKEYTGVTATLDFGSNYKATLPEQIIQFPGKMSGIRAILLNESDDIEFIPISMTQAKFIQSTEVGITSTKIWYTLNRDIVTFRGMSPALAAAGFRMYLAIPFHKYADSDVINIPAGRESDIAKAVIELLSQKPPIDQKADNV